MCSRIAPVWNRLLGWHKVTAAPISEKDKARIWNDIEHLQSMGWHDTEIVLYLSWTKHFYDFEPEEFLTENRVKIATAANTRVLRESLENLRFAA